MLKFRRVVVWLTKSACCLLLVAAGLFWLHYVPNADAQTAETSVADPQKSRFNLPVKTIGGQQLWTDLRNRDGVRVQRNALTGHCRVIDAADVRRGWGSIDQCLTVLDGLKPREATASVAVEASADQPVVVLVHGLMRTHHSMDTLESYLKGELQAKTVSFGYASTRSSIANHASALRDVLEDQPADTTFQFVGHSMGNIVVRHLIGDLNRDGDPAGLLPRFKAMVMLGPPNNGAMIAKRLAKTGVFGWLTGKGAMELGPENDDLQSRLATPAFPFSIVAGDVSDNLIQNPLTEGSGDFVVSIEEARLDGAKEFKVVSRLHSFLMDDEECQAFTSQFFREFAK